MAIKQCLICNKTFDTNSAKRKTCSEECKNMLKLKTIELKAGLDITFCSVCNKPIPYERRIRRFGTCSDECKHEQILINQRKYLSSRKYKTVRENYYKKTMKADQEELKEKERRRKQRAEEHVPVEQPTLEARKLGISYGQYISLKSTGKLTEFKKRQQREKKISENANVYQSCIGD